MTVAAFKRILPAQCHQLALGHRRRVGAQGRRDRHRTEGPRFRKRLISRLAGVDRKSQVRFAGFPLMGIDRGWLGSGSMNRRFAPKFPVAVASAKRRRSIYSAQSIERWRIRIVLPAISGVHVGSDGRRKRLEATKQSLRSHSKIR